MKNFYDLKDELTEDDITQLVKIIGCRCRNSTKVALRSVLTYGRHNIRNVGILTRFEKTDSGVWQYLPGQSYRDEINEIRRMLIK